MTYWQIIRQFVNTVPAYVEMYNRRLIMPARESFEHGVDMLARWDIATKETAKYMKLIDAQKNAAIKIETYVSSQALGAGPKIFRPTSDQMFALEKMKLNLSVSDFAMPYPTVIIELPDEYKKARLPTAECLILHMHDATKFFIHTVLYGDGTSYKSWWPGRPWLDMEEWLVNGPWRDMGDIKVELDEREAEINFRRVALNYCLLLDEVGVKHQGPASPNEYAQLVKWCQKKNVHTPLNKVNLQAQPHVYTMVRKPVDLVRVVGSMPPAHDAEETSRTVSPHSRRGHYRMQPHGVGNCERKRIRIPAVIVNKHLLTGPPPTQEYRT